ncbi:MAG: hypothetical protein E6J34_13410 [Chloroflexi bacterium]|nr:MAG: hypothetical protein E6J34_13410 [Chloroflexota bacterium]
MTLPTSDAQSSRLLPRRPQMTPPTHSMPTSLPLTSPPSTTLSPGSAAGANKTAHEHALDFATHSWDLATGGLKTLTAKRELPTRPDRRSAETLPDATSRSYMYALIILSCVLLMLIGGGIVLFVMLQP